MSIKTHIKQALEEFKSNTNIPYYYLERSKNSTNCLVYSFIEYPNVSSDGYEEQTEYDIYFNLILNTDLDKNTKILKEILKKYGFKKVVINNPYKTEENGSLFYQITMNYKKIIESEE